MERHRRLPDLAEGFEAVYVGEDGVERRVPWGWLPEVPGALGTPVQSFPSYWGSGIGVPPTFRTAGVIRSAPE